ncbi:hypothetical protein HDV63DRAFT_226081 [Trichoderma sp. SZMC 28014]
MFEQVFRAVSSVAVTANDPVTPEQLSILAALIPLLTFPLLPPLHSHKVVFWSSLLNMVSYMFNFGLWIFGAPYIHLLYFTICMTILSLILGWWSVVEQRPYTERDQDDVSLSGYVACSLSSFHFATLGGYFIAFDNLLVWKNTALLIAWCTITLLAVYGIFATFRKPFSTFFYNYTTRRVPVVFWLDRFAIQTYTDVDAGGYTALNSQSDSDDDMLPPFTDVAIDDADDEAGDSSSQEAGEPGASRRAGQNNEDISQLFKRQFGREAGQRRSTGGFTRNTVEEKCTVWGIAAMGFVCASVPVLLALQYIAVS